MELLGTGVQRAGKGSRVKGNGQILINTEWEAEEKGEDQDTVNFESGGIDEGILGIIGATWRFSGDWDAGMNPFDDPPSIVPQDGFPDLSLYINVIDNTGWDFPYARIRSAKNTTQVRRNVGFEASGMNQGDWDRPTGSV